MTGVRRAVRCASEMVLVATLLTAAAGPTWGQVISSITLDQKPADTPAAVDITRRNMAAQGLVDGVQWSLTLEFSGVPRRTVLENISDYLRKKPGAIRIIIDPEVGGLDEAVSISLKDISVEQALKMVLGEQLGYVVQDDGSVLISHKEKLSHYVRRRCYEISQVLGALRLIEEHANARDAANGFGGLFGGSVVRTVSDVYSLFDMIKLVVTGTEQWQEKGGPAKLAIAAGGIMLVDATEEMHQQVVTLCRSLLATAKFYKEAASSRLDQAEGQLATLRAALNQNKEALRKLYVKAGRDEFHLTPQVIFAEAAREKAGPLTPEELLVLADKIEALKAAQQDVLGRIEAQRRLVQSLWEEVNEIPQKPMPAPSMLSRLEGESGKESGEESADESPPMSASTIATVLGNTAFACDLYPLLSKSDDNVFYSPFSISTALAMTWAGARGETEKQMAKTLHFCLSQAKLHPAMFNLLARINGQAGTKKPYQLSIANSLWGQEGFEFKPQFLDVNRINYDAEMQHVDFEVAKEEARQTINAWVAARTQNKIKDLLQPPDLVVDPVRLVLVNAIYFKSAWLVPFNPAVTKTEPFNLLGGKKVSVPMMKQEDHLGYYKGQDFQAVTLEYAGRQLSMLILLPDKMDGLPDLEKSLTAKNLDDWTSKMARKAVQLSMPRFKMTCRADLKKTLQTLGMTDAFDGKRADFSGMAPSATGRRLSISAAIHKAFVEVNEEGTEAAAATAIVVSEGSVEEFATVRMDHPFLFFIRHNATGSLLFVGRVMNPAQ